MKHMAMYCTGQFCFMGLALIATYHWGGDYEGPNAERSAWLPNSTQVDSSGWYMWSCSYANLAGPSDSSRESNSARFVPIVASWWCLGSTYAFVRLKQKSMERDKLDTAESESHESSLTLWIDGIPTDATITEEMITAYLAKHYASNTVSQVRLVYDINALGHNIRRQRRLIIKTNKLIDSLDAEPFESRRSKAIQIQQFVAATRAQLEVLQAQEPALRSCQKQSVGTVFVTFATEAGAQSFRNALASHALPADSTLMTNHWATKMMAPRPAEIYWCAPSPLVVRFVRRWPCRVFHCKQLLLWMVSMYCLPVLIILYSHIHAQLHDQGKFWTTR
jgi:hypothetical protein